VKTPKQVFNELVEKALQLLAINPHKYKKEHPLNKPGGLIAKQSQEDRELLQQLSSKDIGENSLRKEFWLVNPPTKLEKMHILVEKATIKNK